MGLPSGVQWASCNIGAERPDDLGLFFSWGNIGGHMIDEGYDFSQNVYNSTPAADINTDLSLSQDAARAILGGQWRMPTAAEFQELINNCTSESKTVNGVKGRLFTSNVNGETIFFPSAGLYDGTSLVSRGQGGYYWSSTYNSASNALGLSFNPAVVNPQGVRERRDGLTIRAVMSPVT